MVLLTFLNDSFYGFLYASIGQVIAGQLEMSYVTLA